MAGRVVVGVDGSPSSRAALRWAVEEATLRGARTDAIHVWIAVPAPALGEPGLMTLPGAVTEPVQVELVRDGAQAELDAALADAFPDGPPASVETRLVEGDAAQVLEAASEGAELLVVGHRGRSGIASVLLGSVGKHLVDHARCPVVVVKAPSED